MRKIITILFAAILLCAAGAGLASASTAPQPPIGGERHITTFHCPHPLRTFSITADPWVMGQYIWYYGQHGCTYTE